MTVNVTFKAGRRRLLVVVFTGNDDDLLVRHFIDEAVLVRQAARPVTFEFVFEGSGLPMPSKGVFAVSMIRCFRRFDDDAADALEQFFCPPSPTRCNHRKPSGETRSASLKLLLFGHDDVLRAFDIGDGAQQAFAVRRGAQEVRGLVSLVNCDLNLLVFEHRLERVEEPLIQLVRFDMINRVHNDSFTVLADYILTFFARRFYRFNHFGRRLYKLSAISI